MAIITDKHIEIYQNVISEVRTALGRDAIVYMPPTTVDCDWCIADPITGKSSGLPADGYDWTEHDDYVSPRNDKICPECGGAGVVKTEVTHTITCTKKDLDYEKRDDSGVAVFRPGYIRLSCDLVDVLVDTTDVTGATYFDTAVKVLFDGLNYKVVNYSKGGLRDLYTCRIILERI